MITFPLKFLSREIVWGGQLNFPILACLEEQSPSSSAGFWMPQRLWGKEYVQLLHNTCSWGLSYLNCSEKQGLQARLLPKQAHGNPCFRDPQFFQDIWHSSQWHNGGRNLAPMVGGSICMGEGHKASCGQVSMAGFCNLSPSTELGGALSIQYF